MFINEYDQKKKKHQKLNKQKPTLHLITSHNLYLIDSNSMYKNLNEGVLTHILASNKINLIKFVNLDADMAILSRLHKIEIDRKTLF